MICPECHHEIDEHEIFWDEMWPWVGQVRLYWSSYCHWCGRESVMDVETGSILADTFIGRWLLR